MPNTIQGDGVVVHHGAWYNNAEGLWVLTLTNMEANYLLAAIALYITFYSQDFWYAVRWVLHTFRYSDPNPQHVIHHQLQVALRNSGNPGSYLYKCILVWWAWRKVQAAQAWRRCGLEICYSLIVFVGWILAGVFIAVVLEEVPKDVLLSPSSSCGLEYKNWTLQPEEQLPWLRYREQTVASQMPRVDGCWFGNWTKAACSFYPVPKFEMESEKGECPVADHNVCTSDAIEFKIGPVRSDHDLGIDTKPEEAVTYNRISTCSTVDLEKFATNKIVNQSESEILGLPVGSTIKSFDIGPHVRLDGDDSISLQLVNKSALSGYFIDSYQDADPESPVYWNPRDDLFLPTGNWNLFFLRQVGLRYTNMTTDPFLRATVPAPSRQEDPLYYKTSLTMPDNLYTAMVCLTQHQFCQIDNKTCTPWLKFEHLGNTANYSNTVPWTPTQQIIIQRIANQTSQFSLASVVQDLGSTALFASQTLIQDINIGSFSDRQWTSEIERWIAASLAILQFQITRYVGGLGKQVDNTAAMVPGPPELAALCSRQRVLQTGVNTRNFHFQGVLACFLVGIVINALSLGGSKVNDLVQRFRSSEKPGKEWNQDGLFQLHRRHLMLEGVDGWQGLEEEIPVVDRTVIRSTCRDPEAEGAVATGAQTKEGVTMRVQEMA
ncbi:hypothetical protein CAC42_3515 [Sphaceloma murrayae]|uniref:Uncharacterized protein n=1 Tax=Sphaceloma murrayae TaxID=2082308 RepID=A0A2K1R1L5_9PEZI|nr:hypothetical protein CAC42_3515 [Sphaceloma murrayae]